MSVAPVHESVDARGERPAAVRPLPVRIGSEDRAALGEYYAGNVGWLRPTAARIAGGVLGGDDLLSEATVAVITRIAQSTGTVANIGPYIVQSMRNAVKDELKSPRSRVLPLAEFAEVVADDDRAYDRIDAGDERRLIGAAMGRLTAAEQHVLYAVVMLDRRPADVARELGRRADQTHTLLYRAKAKLRAGILRVLLDRHAEHPDCLRASSALPSRLPTGIDHLEQLEPLATHARQCRGCTSALQQYEQLARVAESR